MNGRARSCPTSGPKPRSLPHCPSLENMTAHSNEFQGSTTDAVQRVAKYLHVSIVILGKQMPSPLGHWVTLSQKHIHVVSYNSCKSFHRAPPNMSYSSFASSYVSDCKTPREITLPAIITLHDLQTHLISTFFKGRNTLHLCSTFTF